MISLGDRGDLGDIIASAGLRLVGGVSGVRWRYDELEPPLPILPLLPLRGPVVGLPNITPEGDLDPVASP